MLNINTWNHQSSKWLKVKLQIVYWALCSPVGYKNVKQMADAVAT